MKGAVAALLDIFVLDGLPGLGLLLTTDEEVGGARGVGHILECIDWRPDVVLLPDGGANLQLVCEQKGLIHLRLVARGRAAHAARPWSGINAAERLYRAYRRLQRAYPRPRYEDDWRVSLTLTGVKTGDNPANGVPAYAEGVLDIRYPVSREDMNDVDALVQAVTERVDPLHVEADVQLHVPPYQLDLTSPWVDTLQASAARVLGQPLSLRREAGASDARYFMADHIPVLIFQPECADWHGAHERINIESLGQFRALCADFVRSSLGLGTG